MKMLKSTKALSPVVASIILIAVTVAVSIAVAAWMGALSFSFMGSGEQLKVGSPYGWTNGGTTVYCDLVVPSGSAVSISRVRINGTVATLVAPLSTTQIQPGSGVMQLNATSLGGTFTSGYFYQIVVVTTKGTEFPTTGIVP